jgi:hypothetical protein
VAHDSGPSDKFDGIWHRIGKVWPIVEERTQRRAGHRRQQGADRTQEVWLI